MESHEMNILIVDDDKIVCNTLKVFLSDEGFNVFTVNSGEEAIQLLSREKIDLCVVDMRLPNMDGNTLILQSQKLDPTLKYIIHTGSMNYSPPKSILALGIRPDHVFKKPIKNMARFIEVIHSLGETDPGK